jgi:hypothetical protein
MDRAEKRGFFSFRKEMHSNGIDLDLQSQSSEPGGVDGISPFLMSKLDTRLLLLQVAPGAVIG